MSVCPNCKKLSDDARSSDAGVAKLSLFKSSVVLNKKVVGPGAAALAVILAVSIIISVIFTGGGTTNVIYIKDENVMHCGMRSESQQITENDNGELIFLNYVLGYRNKMFYLLNEELFCCEINSKKESEKLATGVQSYITSKNCKRVLFLTKDKELYIHDLKESNKIDTEVSYLIAYSDDLKRIFYSKKKTDTGTADNGTDLYMYNGKESVLIESGIKTQRVSEDLSTVFYIKDQELYSSNGTKDTKKIDSNVSVIWGKYKNGQLYYAKSKNNNDWESGQMSVYYYNGKESLLIAENVSSFKLLESQIPMAFYSIADHSEDQQAQQNYVVVKGKSTGIDEYASYTATTDGKSIYCTKTASENENGIETKDLYKIDVSGEKVAEAELYDTNIVNLHIEKDGTVWYFKDAKPNPDYPEDSTDLYEIGDLYLNKKLVQRDVEDLTMVQYCEKTKTLAYYADCSRDSEDANFGGTLYFSRNGKKAVKVDEEVFRFGFTSDGQIMYLKNKNKDSNGDLYVNKLGKKSVKIDENVSNFGKISSPEDIKKYY